MTEVLAFPPLLCTRKTAAYLLSTSETGIRELVRQAKLPEIVDGGKWAKYRLEDIRSYIKTLPEKQPS